MQSRPLKQLIYGAFYLAILFGIGYLFYAPFKSPPSCFDAKQNQSETGIDCGGACPPCELKTLKAVTVSPVSILDAGGGRLSLVFELRNPNTSFGADKFSYKISLLSAAGGTVFSFSRQAFIYPGEIKTVIEAGVDAEASRIIRAEVELSDFSWKSKTEFPSVKAGYRELEAEIKDDKVVVAGRVVNDNSFSISKAVVGAIIENDLGFPVGASETSLEAIPPFGTAPFEITIPGTGLSNVSAEDARIVIEAKR